MPSSIPPVTIVVAEDDADDRMMIQEAFDDNNLKNERVFVEDGEELLDYLRSSGKYAALAGKPYPGLILLDLNMPRMDGREALREIKSDPNLCRIPVVILTTSKAEEDIARTYGLGVSSFITKPLNFDDLFSMIKIVCDYWTQIVALPPECTTRRLPAA